MKLSIPERGGWSFPRHSVYVVLRHCVPIPYGTGKEGLFVYRRVGSKLFKLMFVCVSCSPACWGKQRWFCCNGYAAADDLVQHNKSRIFPVFAASL